MNSVTLFSTVSVQAYVICTGSFAVFASFLLILSQIQNRRLRILQKKSRQEVAARLDSLETADRAKNSFLTALSHEIRNPLNGITGLAENLQTATLDEKSRQKLELLRRCTAHLSSLLDDVLDFSKVQPDPFKIHRGTIDLVELMNSVAALVSDESEKRGMQVDMSIDPSLPRYLVGDLLRIRQILLNYIYNGLKHASHGKISVTVRPGKISAENAEIFFAVADEGPGISLAEQARLFVPLQSIPDCKSLPATRQALGLSICKTFAEKINGEVGVESEPGKGSVFYFKATFPLATDLPAAADAASGRSLKSFKTALVIDDEEYNRVALAGMLEALDVQVLAATHDHQALQFATEHKVDLIFVDYSIPGLNGAAVVREIRRSSGHSARAIIIATTAFNTPEIRSECLAAGMDAFLTKPITPEQLRLALGAIAIRDIPSGPSRATPPMPLANLRLLATKKGISFEQELALYFAELETEFRQLQSSLQKEDSGRTAYYAHLLYGRCSFINERPLETKLRKIEFAAATGRWDDAHLIIPEVKGELAELRLRLCSDDPIARRE